MNITKTKMRRGFTIVELLIVIVVIAILAAISIVAYNGIQNRAADAAVQSDVRNLAMKVLEYQAINGEYPFSGSSSSLMPNGIRISANRQSYDPSVSNLYYCVISGTSNSRIGVAARSKSGKVFAFYDGGFQEYSGTFSSGLNICPNMGLPSSEAGFEYHYGYTMSSGGIWYGWAKG